MECQAQPVVLDEWEKAVGAVMDPLNEQGLASQSHRGLNEPGTFSEQGDRVSRGQQHTAIAIPRSRDCFSRVVKNVEIAREPLRLQRDAERHAAGDVAVAPCHAPLG